MVTYSNKNQRTSIREVSYSDPHHGKIETHDHKLSTAAGPYQFER